MVDQYLAGFPYLNLPDRAGYQTALIAIFTRYPQWAVALVIERVDPKMPNIPIAALVFRKMLESEVQPARNNRAWDQRSHQQLAIAGPVTERPRLEDIKADMASRGLPLQQKDTRAHDDALAFKTRFGLTDAQFAALPDLPKEHGNWSRTRAPDHIAKKIPQPTEQQRGE